MMRKSMGMTQSALAKRVGVTRNAVTQWETGATKEIPFPTLVKVADALNVNGRWVAIGDCPPSRAKFPTSDEAELLELYGKLGEEGKEGVIALLRKLVKLERSY